MICWDQDEGNETWACKKTMFHNDGLEFLNSIQVIHYRPKNLWLWKWCIYHTGYTDDVSRKWAAGRFHFVQAEKEGWRHQHSVKVISTAVQMESGLWHFLYPGISLIKTGNRGVSPLRRGFYPQWYLANAVCIQQPWQAQNTLLSLRAWEFITTTQSENDIPKEF